MQPYEYATCKRCEVHLDYHVEVDKQRYSVPHRHIGTTVDVRVSPRMIEIFLNNRALAQSLAQPSPRRLQHHAQAQSARPPHSTGMQWKP